MNGGVEAEATERPVMRRASCGTHHSVAPPIRASPLECPKYARHPHDAIAVAHWHSDGEHQAIHSNQNRSSPFQIKSSKLSAGHAEILEEKIAASTHWRRSLRLYKTPLNKERPKKTMAIVPCIQNLNKISTLSSAILYFTNLHRLYGVRDNAPEQEPSDFDKLCSKYSQKFQIKESEE